MASNLEGGSAMKVMFECCHVLKYNNIWSNFIPSDAFLAPPQSTASTLFPSFEHLVFGVCSADRRQELLELEFLQLVGLALVKHAVPPVLQDERVLQ